MKRMGMAATLVAAWVMTPVGPVEAAPVMCQGERATHVGTMAGEVLRGTPDGDVIVARGGNDTVYAGTGEDLVCAGDGNDRVQGSAGTDELRGEAGNDVLMGGLQIERDELYGGRGNDRFWAQTEDDSFSEGFYYWLRSDRVYPGPGFDRATHTNVKVILTADASGARIGVTHETDHFRNIVGIAGTRHDDVIKAPAMHLMGAGGKDNLHGRSVCDGIVYGGLSGELFHCHIVPASERLERKPADGDILRGQKVRSTFGADRVLGTSGQDTLMVASGGVTVVGDPSATSPEVRDEVIVENYGAAEVIDLASPTIPFIAWPDGSASLPGTFDGTFAFEFGYTPDDVALIRGTEGRDVVAYEGNNRGMVVEGQGGDDKLHGPYQWHWGSVDGGEGTDVCGRFSAYDNCETIDDWSGIRGQGNAPSVRRRAR